MGAESLLEVLGQPHLPATVKDLIRTSQNASKTLKKENLYTSGS